MDRIVEFEKRLDPKRRALLHALRDNDWDIYDVSDDFSDWALDQIWTITSLKTRRGYLLYLKFFKCNGIHDGMNNVVAVTTIDRDCSPYFGEIMLDLQGRWFSKNLSLFMHGLHGLRTNTPSFDA